MKEWRRQHVNTKKNLLSVAILIFASHLGLDIYSPSLPHLVDVFNSTENVLQLAITTYILGSSIAVMLWGPLSDWYGRKPIFIIGASMVIVFALLSPMSQNIYVFLALRFFQGFGSGAALCLGRIIAADMLNKHELSVIGSSMGLITGMAPFIAPIIGGYMQTYYSWEFSFFIHAILTSLALCLFTLMFTESQKEELRPKNLIRLYKKLLSKEFILLASLQGIILSVINTYTVIAPFLVQDEMGKSPLYFAWISGLCAMSQLGSKATAPFLLRTIEAYRVQRLGWSLLILSSLVLLTRLYFPIEALFMMGTCFAFWSVHLVMPYIFSEIFSLNHAKRGMIGSGLTGIALMISFMISSIVAAVPYEGTGLLGLTYLMIGVAGLLLSMRTNHRLLKLQ